MKKRWVISTIGIIGVLIISYFGTLRFLRETPSPKQALNKSGKSYFEPIQITKWTEAKCPCLNIQVGSQVVSCNLDLGFRGHFRVSREILDQIEEKTLLGLRKTYGFRGKEYEMKIFRVPEVQIGRMSFYRYSIEEESENFSADGNLVDAGEKPRALEPGRIGWTAFQITNLLLDLGNGEIAFCDSLATLEKQGYETQSFTKTPLISERGLVEIQAKTAAGYLQCLLDTGSTWNILNTEIKNGQSIDQFVLDEKNSSELLSFKIAETEFGSLTFHHVPIQLPIHIEAVLGMDFFMNNIVFIDFANNLIYFAPNSATTQSQN